MGKETFEREQKTEREVSEDRLIVCAACAEPITHAREAISVEGKHAHTFVNPNGIQFHVRCFGVAQVLPVGEPSSFFSWFSGCAWQVALCRACKRHVGWRFEGAQSFCGLITERIL